MPPRSAVEKSEHRDEIDDLLLQGKSPRFVSSFLKNEYDESISHTAINNYKKKHLNVTKVKKRNKFKVKKIVRRKNKKQLKKFLQIWKS